MSLWGGLTSVNANAGLSQPPYACTSPGSHVNKRCSAFNASVAAGIIQTDCLMQSSLYSYAVLFHCLEKLVILLWSQPTLVSTSGMYQVIYRDLMLQKNTTLAPLCDVWNGECSRHNSYIISRENRAGRGMAIISRRCFLLELGKALITPWAQQRLSSPFLQRQLKTLITVVLVYFTNCVHLISKCCFCLASVY